MLEQIRAIWRALPKRTRINKEAPMTIRVPAIEETHCPPLNAAASPPPLTARRDVELVAIKDPDAGLVARRAAELGTPPPSTDYRQMLAKTRPDFVVALG